MPPCCRPPCCHPTATPSPTKPAPAPTTAPTALTALAFACPAHADCLAGCRGGRDPPPLQPRHPPRVWLCRHHRHALLLLPGGSLDRWVGGVAWGWGWGGVGKRRSCGSIALHLHCGALQCIPPPLLLLVLHNPHPLTHALSCTFRPPRWPYLTLPCFLLLPPAAPCLLLQPAAPSPAACLSPCCSLAPASGAWWGWWWWTLRRRTAPAPKGACVALTGGGRQRGRQKLVGCSWLGGTCRTAQPRARWTPPTHHATAHAPSAPAAVPACRLQGAAGGLPAAQPLGLDRPRGLCADRGGGVHGGRDPHDPGAGRHHDGGALCMICLTCCACCAACCACCGIVHAVHAAVCRACCGPCAGLPAGMGTQLVPACRLPCSQTPPPTQP